MPYDTVIQVILPLRLEWEPCYLAPETVRSGDRVAVSFARRQYIAVVHRTGVETDLDPAKILPVVSTDTGLPAITSRELELWEFISSYYLCTIGEVYYAAYPNHKVRSEEVAARAALSSLRRTAGKIASLEGRLEKVKARIEAKSAALSARENSQRASAEVTGRIRAELEVLEERRAAIEKQIASIASRTEKRKPEKGPCKSARKAVKPELIQSSSRLQTYREAIEEALSQGRQALILTPDLLYCRSLSSALSADFPQLREFSSSQTAVSRRRTADSVREGDASIVVGTRSAVLLPFYDLGLIIVDEEQDNFYKQSEPAPRYQGRDCAVKLGSIHSARVILGSSCPSLETVLNARCGRYRVLEGSGPAVRSAQVIDLAAERRKRGVTGAFSFKLIEAVRKTSRSVVLIRGWERPEEVSAQIEELFPDRDIKVMRYLEAREADLAQTELVAILQADALVAEEDFRADEKAVQMVCQLSSRCPLLIVQTNVPSRFDGSRSIEELLDERRDFGFPPFTRLLEVRRRGSAEVIGRFFLKKDSSLAERKAQIATGLAPDTYPDVDPYF